MREPSSLQAAIMADDDGFGNEEDWENGMDADMAPGSDEEGEGEEEEEYDYGSDGGDCDFDDYYDEDCNDMSDSENVAKEETGEENVAIVLENTFYEAADLLAQNQYGAALEKYERVVTMEADPKNKGILENMREGPWTFPALSKIVLIHLAMGNTEKMTEDYGKMLRLVNDSDVSTNAREDAINSILTHPALKEGLIAKSTVEGMYEAALKMLKRSDRLWFSTCLSQARLYLQDRSSFSIKLPALIRTLFSTCRREDGTFDRNKASDLLEVYAIEMKFLFLKKSFCEMKTLYPKTKGESVTNAVEDSRTMGPLREFGGRMWMHFRQWMKAYYEFFDAFKAYEDAGKSVEAKRCIKYLVTANIIACGQVNPFAAREIIAYSQHDDVQTMKHLRDAFHEDEVRKFEDILRFRKNGIVTDPFLKTYVDDLLETMRMKVLKRLIRPYRRIRLSFLSKKLAVDVVVAQRLLERLVLDGEISGKIDDVEGCFEKNEASASDRRKFEALEAWSEKLDALRASIGSYVAKA
eukprot:g2803.t1